MPLDSERKIQDSTRETCLSEIVRLIILMCLCKLKLSEKNYMELFYELMEEFYFLESSLNSYESLCRF